MDYYDCKVCSDCGNTFEDRYLYTDSDGLVVCKYCYEGNYETDEEGRFIERVFEINEKDN